MRFVHLPKFILLRRRLDHQVHDRIEQAAHKMMGEIHQFGFAAGKDDGSLLSNTLEDLAGNRFGREQLGRTSDLFGHGGFELALVGQLGGICVRREDHAHLDAIRFEFGAQRVRQTRPPQTWTHRKRCSRRRR